MLSLTSCSLGGKMKNIFFDDDVPTANNTIKAIVKFLNSKDAIKLEALFSPNARNLADFTEDVSDLIEFVKGDIISISDANDAGVSVDSKSEHGKKCKSINSAFTVKTDTKTYYISIFECTHDDFDSNNIGITSLHIIESENWQINSRYRGYDRKELGIDIDTRKIMTEDDFLKGRNKSSDTSQS